MSYLAGRDLNSAQLRRLATLIETHPSCKVVGYRFWDSSNQNIVPIIEYPSGDITELRPHGRMHTISYGENRRALDRLRVAADADPA